MFLTLHVGRISCPSYLPPLLPAGIRWFHKVFFTFCKLDLMTLCFSPRGLMGLISVQTSASFAAIFWRALWYQAALGLKRPHAGLVGRGTGHGCPQRAPARDPQAKPPPRSFPEGVPRQGPAAAGPSEKRGRVERRSPTSDPSGAPRITGSSGRKLSAARARRPAGRMTKFGRAPRRRLPFMAHSPAADVAARGPRPRGCGHG